MTTEKIAISLPPELLDEIERERKATAETRSAFIRRAVEARIRALRLKEEEERYVAGYRAQPESDEELAWAELGARELAREPWE